MAPDLMDPSRDSLEQSVSSRGHWARREKKKMKLALIFHFRKKEEEEVSIFYQLGPSLESIRNIVNLV